MLVEVRGLLILVFIKLILNSLDFVHALIALLLILKFQSGVLHRILLIVLLQSCVLGYVGDGFRRRLLAGRGLGSLHILHIFRINVIFIVGHVNRLDEVQLLLVIMPVLLG